MDLTWLYFIEGKNAPDVMILNSKTLLSGGFYCSRVTAVSVFKFISGSETTSMPNAIRILNVMLTHGGQVHCSSSSQNSPQSSALSFRLSHHFYQLTTQNMERERQSICLITSPQGLQIWRKHFFIQYAMTGFQWNA